MHYIKIINNFRRDSFKEFMNCCVVQNFFQAQIFFLVDHLSPNNLLIHDKCNLCRFLWANCEQFGGV